MTDPFNAKYLCFKNRHINYVPGYLKNVSNEKESRFDVKQKSNAIGKIDVSNTADQALKNFRSFTKNPSHIRPLVLAATNGNVSVEALSWMGAITRRYGMEGKNGENEGGKIYDVMIFLLLNRCSWVLICTGWRIIAIKLFKTDLVNQ